MDASTGIPRMGSKAVKRLLSLKLLQKNEGAGCIVQANMIVRSNEFVLLVGDILSFFNFLSKKPLYRGVNSTARLQFVTCTPK